MGRLSVFLVLVGGSVLAALMSGHGFFDTTECINDSCHVQVASAPPGILFGLALFYFLLAYPQRESMVDATRVVGVWRRFGAFYLDFLAVAMMFGPVLVVPHLLAEARITGTFHWAFERDFVRPDDWLYSLVAAFAMLAAWFWYYYRHGRSGRPTFGQYILGYRIVADPAAGKAPEWGARVALAFIGMCVWPISLIFALRKPNKAFWWDAETGTAVVRVAPLEEKP